MKRILIALFGLLCAAGISAEELTRYELDVKDFIELKVTDGINVDYRCNPDSAGKAVFFASPDKASLIMFTPGKNKLQIQLAPSEGKVSGIPTVTVYSTYLTHAENAGDSTLRVINVAPGPKFKARVIGNGRVVVRDVEATQVEASLDTGNGLLVVHGKCDVANMKCTGTGNIQADGLMAQDVKCRMLGTGSVGCYAVKTLTVTGAGSGHVYYKGSPEIKNRSIGVKVEALAE